MSRATLVVGFVVGGTIDLVGFQWIQTIDGCVPPANVQCNPPMPIIIVYGWVLLVPGTAMAVGSMWGLVRSSRKKHSESSNGSLTQASFQPHENR